jgi:hypothetical protein
MMQGYSIQSESNARMAKAAAAAGEEEEEEPAPMFGGCRLQQEI